MIPAHKNTKNPPGQIVHDVLKELERKADLVRAKQGTPGFDRYPWLKTSTYNDTPAQRQKRESAYRAIGDITGWDQEPRKDRPSNGPISPAKRLGDIIDRVVASSSEDAVKGSYEDGYKAGWNAAIEAVVKKQLDNF